MHGMKNVSSMGTAQDYVLLRALSKGAILGHSKPVLSMKTKC